MQQGDPLGPLLFSLVIQEVVLAIRSQCPDLDLNKWYLDDGVIGGRNKLVSRALEVIQTVGPPLGMELNLSKNEIVKFTTQADCFPAEFKRFYRNFELLGAPIGDEVHCTEFIVNYTKKRVQHIMGALMLIQDPQVVHFLLRLCCAFCRVVHLTRTVPFHFAVSAWEFFDDAVVNACSKGLGVIFSPEALEQLALPFSRGGLGLRKASDHAAGAYLASVSFVAEEDNWPAPSAVGWTEALRDFCIRAAVSESFVLEAKAPPKQRDFSAAVDTETLKALTAISSPLDKARLLSVSTKGSGAWLGVIPSVGLNQAFDSRQFTTLVRWWLGMPVYDKINVCPSCGEAMDRLGYHALTCRTGGSLGVRHNALREIVLHYCKIAKIEAVREAPNLLPNSSDRPADVLLPKNIFIEGYNSSLRTCLDFAVTHPQQPATIKRAGIVSGAAAARYEEAVKLPRYLQECAANNLDFIPMVVESFGTWGRRAEPVLKFIARAAAFNKKNSEDNSESFLRAALNVTLMRHNADTLISHRDRFSLQVDGPVPET